MTDQTPSTEQVERARFKVSDVHHSIGTECLCGARRLHKNRDRTEHILDAFIKELDLAAHDREVAAKALYDARDDWRKGGWAGTPHHHDRGRDRIAAAQYAGNWLNDRADRIEVG